jgi:hypothetical protein
MWISWMLVITLVLLKTNLEMQRQRALWLWKVSIFKGCCSHICIIFRTYIHMYFMTAVKVILLQLVTYFATISFYEPNYLSRTWLLLLSTDLFLWLFSLLYSDLTVHKITFSLLIIFNSKCINLLVCSPNAVLLNRQLKKIWMIVTSVFITP